MIFSSSALAPRLYLVLRLSGIALLTIVSVGGAAGTLKAEPIVVFEDQILARVGPPDPYDSFGSSVTISGDTLVVGSFSDTRETTLSSGSAYIFSRTGSQWVQTQTLAPVNSGHFFGQRVEVKGDRMAIASRGYAQSSPNGAVYMYEKGDNGLWAIDQIVEAPLGYGFARSLDFDGESLIVGAGDGNSRRAFIYTQVDGQWLEQARFYKSTGLHYGFTVGIGGDLAVVGGYTGGLDIYRRVDGEWLLDGNTYLNPGHTFDAVDQMNISIDEGRIIVGAQQLNSGGIYVIEKVDGAWATTSLLRSGAEGSTGTYWSVDLEGDWLLAGAHRENRDSENFRGAAYLFHYSNSEWVLKQKLLGNGTAPYVGFGLTVDLDGNTAVVGGGRGNGARTYVFNVPEPSAAALASLAMLGCFLACHFLRSGAIAEN